ncbi:hypothetical protein BDW62DRAFT_199056 [Aspergillus aurantiobrunneus]
MGGRRRNTDTAAVEASSGLVYDLANSGLDLETKSRALLGLKADFDVLFCGRGKTAYEFAFAERLRVRIAVPAGMDGGEESEDVDVDEIGYICTCAVFRGRADVACQHIFWLLDQLRRQFVSASPPSKILLSSDGHAQGYTRIERLLSNPATTVTLEDLAERLNWLYLRSAGEEGGMSRTQRVRDILSAFSTDVLPEEFRVDLVESEDETGHILPERLRTPEQCVVQGDFEATAFRLAVHDDNVFTSLCKAMPPGACAAIYFDKMLERSRKALSKFDQHCQTLGKPDEDGDKDKALSLADVLETLQANTLNIHKNIHTRTPNGLQGAAKALTTLLEDISTRDKDALARNRYGRVSFADENEDSRNLYHQLIGKADDNAVEHFILDALADLSGEDLYPFRERLQAVLHRVEVNRAPKGFILKLGGIVRVAEMGLTRKRAARAGEGEAERGRKRVR